MENSGPIKCPSSPVPPQQLPCEYDPKYLAACIGIPLKSAQKVSNPSQSEEDHPAAKRTRINGVSDDTFQEDDDSNSSSSSGTSADVTDYINHQLKTGGVVTITKCSLEYAQALTEIEKYKKRLAVTVSQLSLSERERLALSQREQHCVIQVAQQRRELQEKDKLLKKMKEELAECEHEKAGLYSSCHQKDTKIRELRRVVTCRPSFYNLGSTINLAQRQRIEELEEQLRENEEVHRNDPRGENHQFLNRLAQMATMRSSKTDAAKEKLQKEIVRLAREVLKREQLRLNDQKSVVKVAQKKSEKVKKEKTLNKEKSEEPRRVLRQRDSKH